MIKPSPGLMGFLLHKGLYPEWCYRHPWCQGHRPPFHGPCHGPGSCQEENKTIMQPIQSSMSTLNHNSHWEKGTSTYKTWWKAIVMLGCVRNSVSGRKLCNSGITTCWYQSSTFIASKVGLPTETDVFPGEYMSASSATVQLSKNCVRVVLRIWETSLWGSTTHSHFKRWGWISVQSGLKEGLDTLYTGKQSFCHACFWFNYSSYSNIALGFDLCCIYV